MDNPPKRRRRSFGFWAAVVLIIGGGVLYPLSFGPACWVASRMHEGRLGCGTMKLYAPLSAAYRPLLFAMNSSPILYTLARGYARLASAQGAKVNVGVDSTGNPELVFLEEPSPPPFSIPAGD